MLATPVSSDQDLSHSKQLGHAHTFIQHNIFREHTLVLVCKILIVEQLIAIMMMEGLLEIIALDWEGHQPTAHTEHFAQTHRECVLEPP